MKKKDLLVIKFGSSSITDKNGVDEDRLIDYANKLASINKNYSIIVVSSGSVTSGKAIWKTLSPQVLEDIQALAMVGSASIVSKWQDALLRHSIIASQLLVTHNEIEDAEERKILVTALKNCIEEGIVPIVNENDALSIRELNYLAYGGDNDGLASHIARIMDAKSLLILTDTDGLYDDKKQLVRLVKNTHKDHRRARSFAHENHKGKNQGMFTKIESCLSASRAGIDSFIASAGSDYQEVIQGKVGTHFEAKYNNVTIVVK